MDKENKSKVWRAASLKNKEDKKLTKADSANRSGKKKEKQKKNLKSKLH
jgi:hypothetical protein